MTVSITDDDAMFVSTVIQKFVYGLKGYNRMSQILLIILHARFCF